MPGIDDLSRSLVAFEEDSTLVAVIDMSLSSWVVLGLVPGLRRRPEKKLGADEEGLLSLLHRWRDEAERCGRSIRRICVTFEAGRDGFWLARWLAHHGIEPHVIHASSIPVKREQRRAKTDRPSSAGCVVRSSTAGWSRFLRSTPRMRKPRTANRSARSRDCTRMINRMKATLARLGIRGFNPELKRASHRLDDLRLPTGEALPPNAVAAVDRLVHHTTILEMNVESYRRRAALENSKRKRGRPANFATEKNTKD